MMPVMDGKALVKFEGKIVDAHGGPVAPLEPVDEPEGERFTIRMNTGPD